MQSPSVAQSISSEKVKRRRDFTPEERVAMHNKKASRYQNKAMRHASLAAAGVAAKHSARDERHAAHTIENARSALPQIHEQHKFITTEQSQMVIRLMVFAYDLLCPSPMWFARAVPDVARSTGIGEDMVRAIWKTFDETGEFYETERPVPPKSAAAAELDAQAREFLDERLQGDAKIGIMYNTHKIQVLLREHFNVGFSSYYVKQMMAEMGYHFKKASQDWTVGMKSPRRQRQLLFHLIMLDKAMAEVKAGKAVILFTDQTFIDTRTHTRYGYIHPEKTHAHFPKGTGLRVAHMHALTSNGLLAVTGPDGKPVIPPSSDDTRGKRASEDALTAELSFSLRTDQGAPESDGSEREKKGFSAKVCADWVEHRLIPAARAVWPKPMQLYLYMDNFSGHSGRDKEAFWPVGGTGHTREWNLLNLKEAGCMSLVHNGTEFTIDALLASPKLPGGPNVKQLISLGRDWMWLHHPENALSGVQSVALSDGYLQIIFSVPLTPDANPIEYWWGSCKGGLARLWDGDVAPEVIIDRWRIITLEQGMAMDGADTHGSVPAINSRCKSYVDAAIRWAEENLLPLSSLAGCGSIGSLDLSKATGAVELAKSLDATPRLYYRCWKECESLSLQLPDAVGAEDEDEDVDV